LWDLVLFTATFLVLGGERLLYIFCIVATAVRGGSKTEIPGVQDFWGVGMLDIFETSRHLG
jgi:hypothetical protein